MKPYFLVLLVGIGSAWGQNQSLTRNGDQKPIYTCEDSIEFQGKSKAIKDIFPEECPAKTVQEKMSGPMNPCGLGSPATEDKAKVEACMQQLLGEIQKPELSGIEGLHGGGSDRGILVEDSAGSGQAQLPPNCRVKNGGLCESPYIVAPPKPPDAPCMVQLAKGANLPVVIAEMTITPKSQNCIVGIDPEMGPVVIRFLDIERPGSFPDIERPLSPGGSYIGMFLTGATESAPEQDPNPAVFYPVPPNVPAIIEDSGGSGQSQLSDRGRFSPGPDLGNDSMNFYQPLIDMPAIRETIICLDFTADWCDQTYKIPSEEKIIIGSYTLVTGLHTFREHGYFCPDKRRILLTAEDGKKWCHAVQSK